MIKNNKKLLEVIYNNRNYPIIIEGASVEDLPVGVILPADINSADLGIVASDTGLKYPIWIMEIMMKAKKDNNIKIVIEGMDDIDKVEQEKFFGILKYKGVNGYKFPQGTQILIPIKKNNIDKLSDRLVSLSIVYKVD